MKKAIIGGFVYLLPAIALAQFNSNYINGYINGFRNVVNGALIPLVIAIALFLFIWGLIKFFLAKGDEDAMKQGKKLMLWGIVVFFVIVAIWGIVNFLSSSLNLNTNRPTFPSTN